MTPFFLTDSEQLDNDRQVQYVVDPTTNSTMCSVITPIHHTPNVPLWCDVCGFPLKDVKDYHAYLQASCCSHCQDEFYCSNVESWNVNKEAVMQKYHASGKFSQYVERRLASWKPRVRLK